MLVKFEQNVARAINTERIESISDVPHLDCVKVTMFSGEVFYFSEEDAKRLIDG